MEQTVIEPGDINKNPKIIRESQNDISKIDILVCGGCHAVHHFIEGFQEHKLECTGESEIKNADPKDQVWAFLLWKNSQLKNPDAKNDTSWNMYQKWCKMDKHVKDSWMVAGRNLQAFSRLSSGKVQEVIKSPGRVVEEKKLNNSVTVQRIAKTQTAQKIPKDPLALNESETEEIPKTIIRKTNHNNTPVKKDIVSTTKPVMLTESVVIEPAEKKVVSPAAATAETSPVVVSANTCRLAMRHDRITGVIAENTIDKVLAKRFNPRRKYHEYLIKWQGMPSEQNTWEPALHMEKSKPLLEAFERSLARQKEQKALAAAAAKKNNANASPVRPSSPLLGPGRPQRSSKQRALNQVKAWCGDITEEPGVRKRRSADEDDDEDADGLSDSDEADEKRLRRSSGDERTSSAPVKLSTPVIRRPVGRPPVSRPSVAATASTTPKAAAPVGGARKPNNATLITPNVKIVRKPAPDDLMTSTPDSDSDDDGLPDDFPDEISIPVAESPPREFTLCPLTGRVLGQPENEPEPEPEPPVTSSEDNEIKVVVGAGEPTTGATDLNMELKEEDSEQAPMLITAEDGIVYQVAGQDEQGQTVLVAHTPSGEQQCVILTHEDAAAVTGDDDGTGNGTSMLTLDAAIADAVSEEEDANAVVGTTGAALTIQTEGSEQQVVAEVVKAELPSPGGTRKVVLLLPDGNLMMTEVDAEQYAALELDQ